ncbi:hypothetical protein CTAYLR_002011 [Chrysophaeum taylorii]|uniref:Uncharacterized protein n=1 Tax=Chrysophaeum taylorii TaxID=2483200 RepID=A0AAD7U8H3_9STRA|nr:hypothetical protein CTAYLR_002011 [Chrysophaeum taylorii]
MMARLGFGRNCRLFFERCMGLCVRDAAVHKPERKATAGVTGMAMTTKKSVTINAATTPHIEVPPPEVAGSQLEHVDRRLSPEEILPRPFETFEQVDPPPADGPDWIVVA